MKADQIHPELRAIYRRIPSVPLHNRLFIGVANALQALMPRKLPQVDGLEITDIPLGGGYSRLYRPTPVGSGAGLLWIHGGGYIIGNAALNDRECIALARELGLTVLSAEYRLAPRHPFPAGLDDCFEAWQTLLAKAPDWGIDPQRLAIAGQSAGGGLAAGLAQRIRDAGGVQPAAQILMYPMIDDRTAADHNLDGVRHRLWNNRNNRGAWAHYLNQPAGLDSAPPYAAPARTEDLSKLPPAWIGVGEADLFFQEDCEYAQRLRDQGTPCELHTTPQAPHAFDIIVADAPVSKAFCDSYKRFLARALAIET